MYPDKEETWANSHISKFLQATQVKHGRAIIQNQQTWLHRIKYVNFCLSIPNNYNSLQNEIYANLVDAQRKMKRGTNGFMKNVPFGGKTGGKKFGGKSYLGWWPKSTWE